MLARLQELPASLLFSEFSLIVSFDFDRDFMLITSSFLYSPATFSLPMRPAPSSFGVAVRARVLRAKSAPYKSVPR
jgi:hypothetical protein